MRALQVNMLCVFASRSSWIACNGGGDMSPHHRFLNTANSKLRARTKLRPRPSSSASERPGGHCRPPPRDPLSRWRPAVCPLRQPITPEGRYIPAAPSQARSRFRYNVV